MSMSLIWHLRVRPEGNVTSVAWEICALEAFRKWVEQANFKGTISSVFHCSF